MLADRTTIVPPREAPAPGPLPSARLLPLDGLRGIAILLVMNFHFTRLAAALILPTPHAFDAWAMRVAGVGWCGVDLFFVLSGFLITGILYDSRTAAKRYFRNFYARRFLRIMPAYYVFLILLLVLLPAVYSLEKGAALDLRAHQLWYWTYTSNWRPAFNSTLTPDFLIASHLWSLAIEEQFYLVWPAVVFLVPRRGLIWICVGAIVCAPALRLVLDLAVTTPEITYTLTPARLDPLAIGALVALIARDPAGVARLSRFAAPVALVAGVTLLVLFFARVGLDPVDTPVQTLGFSALAVLFGAILVAVLAAPVGSPANIIASTPVLRWFGRYSYAVYLVHWPIGALLARRVDFPASVVTVFGSRFLGTASFELLAGAVSVAAAWLSWNLLEKYFLRLKKWFPYERNPEAAPTQHMAQGSRPTAAPQPIAR